MKKQELVYLKKKLLTYSLLSSLAIVPASTNVLSVNASSYSSTNSYVSDNNTQNEKDNLISYYAHVFQIKEEIVKDELLKETENLSSYTWNHFHRINDTDYDSTELAILELTKDIYYNPENYNYTKEEVTSEYEYTVSLSPEEMVAKYSKVYGINKEVALSIVYTECGAQVNSYNYLNNNNPAGLGPHMHFLNKEVGMIYFISLLKNNYQCEADSDENFLSRIASTYCEIPDHWLSLSLPFYHNLKEDYLYYNKNLEGEIDMDLYEVQQKKQVQKKKTN